MATVHAPVVDAEAQAVRDQIEAQVALLRANIAQIEELVTSLDAEDLAVIMNAIRDGSL